MTIPGKPPAPTNLVHHIGIAVADLPDVERVTYVEDLSLRHTLDDVVEHDVGEPFLRDQLRLHAADLSRSDQ